jgi:transposase-like protein
MKDSAARTLEQVGSSLRSRARRYQSEHGPRCGRYPEEFKREIVALLGAGIPVAELAGRVEIPQQTIYGWKQKINLKKNEVPKPCPLRIVDAPSGEGKDALTAEVSARCVVRLPGGVEIVMESKDVDARLLRTVMEVVR